MDNDIKKPKRLLSISTDRLLFHKGSAVQLRMAGYAKEWDEMHIVVASDKSFVETAIAPNIWIYPTRSKVRALYPHDAARLGRFIIERRGITHITCQDPFLTAFAGTTLQRQHRLPLEIQVHTDIGSPNFPHTIGNKIRKAMALSYLPKADTIRVVAEKTKRYLTDILGIPEAKITVRPIAVDTDAIKNAPIIADLHQKYPKAGKIVLMASRLTHEKNIPLAIEAWPGVRAAYPTAGLVIVGGGDVEAHLKKLAAKSSEAASIAFEAWADPATLISYYKSADLFLTTSLFEGYGMTLIEAKAAGCSIVSTDVGVAREIGARIVEWEKADVIRGITEALAV